MVMPCSRSASGRRSAATDRSGRRRRASPARRAGRPGCRGCRTAGGRSGALAVIHAARGQEAQGLVRQFLAGVDVFHRCSSEIAFLLAALHRGLGVRSSMRVAPRSETVTCASRRRCRRWPRRRFPPGRCRSCRRRCGSARRPSRPRPPPGAASRRSPAPAGPRRYHLALVRVVDARQRDVLAGDVLPDVEFGPVARSGRRGSARPWRWRVLNRFHSSGAAQGLPLAEGVAVAEDALLGARLLFVAAGAADRQSKRFSSMARAASPSGGRCAIPAGAPDAPCRASMESSRCDDQALAHLGDRASRNSITSGSCGRCRHAPAGRAGGR